MDEKRTDGRPKMLLVYGDSAFAAKTSRHYRRQGWDVRMAGSAAEARRLVERLDPMATVVDGESFAGPAALGEDFFDRCAGQCIVLVTDHTAHADSWPEKVRLARRDNLETVADSLLVG